jgi:hypothetical protein
VFLFRLFLLFTTFKFAIITWTQGAWRPPVSIPAVVCSATDHGMTGNSLHTDDLGAQRKHSSEAQPRVHRAGNSTPRTKDSNGVPRGIRHLPRSLLL